MTLKDNFDTALLWFIRIIILVFLAFVYFNNVGCAVNPNYIEQEEVAKVIAIGQGTTMEDSKTNAFVEAIHKAFGTRVDSSQIVEKQVLVKDTTVLSNAEQDSQIKSYKILEQTHKGDIYFTKIEALVSVTHRQEVSSQRRMVREEWNNLVAGPNPIIGIGQVGMKIGGEIKQYWTTWFGKAKE